MKRFMTDDEGVSPVVALVVSVFVFTAVFGFTVYTAVGEGQKAGSDPQADLDSAAVSLADLVVAPGVGWYASGACDGTELDPAYMDPDDVAQGRFGLGREPCGDPLAKRGDVNLLQYDKVSNLFHAEMNADGTNTYVDYEEAHRSLGLGDTGRDFHLRSEPVLASVREILRSGYKDQNLRPLYIADYVEGTGGSSRPVISHSGSVMDTTDFATVTVTIDNTGTVQSPFQVSFSVPLSNGVITSTQNTFDILAGGSGSVTLQLRKTLDWTWDTDDGVEVKEVQYTISDDVGPLASGTVSLEGVPMTASTTNTIPVLNMDRLRYVEPFDGSNKWPKAIYSGYDGTGVKKDNFDGSKVDLKVVETTPGYEKLYTNPAKSGQSLQDTDAEPDEPKAGKYRVELWVPDTTGTVYNDDVFEVLGGGAEQCNVSPGQYVPADSAVIEAGYVDQLFEQYEKNVFSGQYTDSGLPYAAGGDVMPDIKCTMNNDLPNFLLDPDTGEPTTDVYTTLVVGSNVDHNAMTSSAAKETIRDWVFGGGTLIVFGSDEQSVTWLQPIFHSALSTAGGGLYTPDPTHPILSVPNDLDYNSYDPPSTQWEYNAHHEEKFTHVVTTGGEADILGVGNPGSFGEGKVILTSWRAYDLTADQAAACADTSPETQCQGLFLLHNLVTLSYRELYLDYGPPLPLDRPHGSVLRVATVDHPELELRIAMRVMVYVF